MILTGQGDIYWAPPVDIYESEGCWLVFVELPGLSSEDVELTVYSESIVVSGVKKPPVREMPAEKLEICSGWFRREIRLPGRIAVEGTSASLKDGVLKVVLPAEDDRSFRIPVEGRKPESD